MYRLIPGLLAALVYLWFQKYVVKRRVTGNRLYLEAFSFAVVTYVVMWVWKTYMGFEGMSTFGSTCPNGSIQIPDPANPQQPTCVPNPNGKRTYPANTGFGAIASLK